MPHEKSKFPGNVYVHVHDVPEGFCMQCGVCHFPLRARAGVPALDFIMDVWQGALCAPCFLLQKYTEEFGVWKQRK